MDTIESRKLAAREGFDLTVTMHPDYDSTPGDADCYTEADHEAFNRGAWGYVGLMVTASRHGVELGTASLWGMEYGSLPGVAGYVDPIDADDAHGAETVADLESEAIAEARATLSRLCDGGAP